MYGFVYQVDVKARGEESEKKQHKKEMVSWSDGMLGWIFNGLFSHPNDKDY
jgi:hypothetical protein